MSETKPGRARKKWRLKMYPSFTYQPTRSMRETYDLLLILREQYAANLSPVHQVDVEVNEGGGFNWQLHERVVFPDREAAR